MAPRPPGIGIPGYLHSPRRGSEEQESRPASEMDCEPESFTFFEVPDDRRRTRLAHALKDFGERVQYSVFECRLDLEDLEKLRQRVERLTDPEKDRVRIYRLCKECTEQVEIRGQGKMREDPDIYVL